MLPMAAPISRFRLTVLSFHSNTTIAAPINAPTPASLIGESPNGLIAKQVAATTITKRRRTKIISTVNLPADAAFPCYVGCAPVPTPAAQTGFDLAQCGAYELGEMNARPVSNHEGLWLER